MLIYTHKETQRKTQEGNKMTKRESDWNTYNELRRYHKMIDDTVIENSNVRIMLFLT